MVMSGGAGGSGMIIVVVVVVVVVLVVVVVVVIVVIVVIFVVVVVVVAAVVEDSDLTVVICLGLVFVWRQRRPTFERTQVVSEFSAVVTSNRASATKEGGNSGYPASASTFAAALSVSNFDVLGFVPVGCILPNADFYQRLIFKTISPFAAIGLLWLYLSLKHVIVHRTSKTSVMSAAAALQARAKALRTAARWTMVIMDLLLCSTSTAVVQTFICTCVGLLLMMWTPHGTEAELSLC